MITPLDHIKAVAAQTDRILLFHSAAGKDSIALLDMLTPHFKEVVCVYMYVVKDLQHLDNYIEWAKAKYCNATFINLPHYALGGYIKTGFMGIAKDPTQKLYNIAAITDRARLITGIQWAVFGFKQSDSLNRRLMLRTYDGDAINWNNEKLYPLSAWKNGDVLKYIESRRLIKPLNYGGKHQSSGAAVNDINFLMWCKQHFPGDLQKIYNQFPDAEILVYQHENKLTI